MEILGFLLAVIMGFTLGLLGGGGSILTVPILVYIVGIDPVLGTAYSLFVVGFSALVGVWRKHAEGLVVWKTGIIFALPSLLAVFLTRYYLVPWLPKTLFTINDFTLSKDMAIMVLFGLIMIPAAFSMMRKRKETAIEEKAPNFPLIVVEGLVVGTVTGLIGAGGGFLIVPALVLLVGLPIKEAIGTSLLIIAIKSLIGFLGDVGSGQDIDWTFLAMFTGFSLVGMMLGVYTTRFVKPEKLKSVFGWFVLVMGIVIIAKEVMQ